MPLGSLLENTMRKANKDNWISRLSSVILGCCPMLGNGEPLTDTVRELNETAKDEYRETAEEGSGEEIQS